MKHMEDFILVEKADEGSLGAFLRDVKDSLSHILLCGEMKRSILAKDLRAARRWFRVFGRFFRSFSRALRKARMSSLERCSTLSDLILMP